MKGTPNNLGETADRLLKLRTERIQLQKEVEQLKKNETALQDQLTEELIGQGLTSAGGKLATISLNPMTVPTVVNWGALEKYIASTGHFHLMQKRMSSKAYIEHLAQVGPVPGVDPTTLTKLSLTRSSK